MSEYPKPIRIVKDLETRKVTWGGWVTGRTTGTNSSRCWLKLGGMNGTVSFNLTNGYGSKTKDGDLSEWKIHDEDRDELIDWAFTRGRKIYNLPKSPGRTPGKKKVSRCDRTIDMFMDEETW